MAGVILVLHKLADRTVDDNPIKTTKIFLIIAFRVVLLQPTTASLFIRWLFATFDVHVCFSKWSIQSSLFHSSLLFCNFYVSCCFPIIWQMRHVRWRIQCEQVCQIIFCTTNRHSFTFLYCLCWSSALDHNPWLLSNKVLSVHRLLFNPHHLPLLSNTSLVRIYERR